LRVSQLPLDDGGAVRIFTDITHQRQVEAQLMQAQRLDALGQMTAGIAHDFNNLLGVIVTNLDMMHDGAGGAATQPDAELLDRARNAALTAADLVRGLLAFSRQKALQIEPVDTTQLLSQCLLILRQALAERLIIETAFDDDLWPVQVDASQIEMALLNLALNARDASPPGSVLQIQARNVTLDAAATNSAMGAGDAPLPGDYVVVSVADQGSGMDASTLARVFEPFFSTKGPGAGSGLGLSIVFGTMRQLGSTVTVESEPGRGTSVTLYLPRSRVMPAKPARRAAATRQRGLRVMLVEDNDDLRETAQSLLEWLGHEVVALGDAAEALALWEYDQGFDLVFSDVVMPGTMNGVQLVRELRARTPGLKVLLTSGFAEMANAQDAQGLAGLPILHKPYRKDDLAACLQTIFMTG
jgi:signal transduction histidine kinase/CheY-like chemotaxis protein